MLANTHAEAVASVSPSGKGAGNPGSQREATRKSSSRVDTYFSVDVETDGPIPGPYSMLSFAMVEAGSFDGDKFHRASREPASFYAELRPISPKFEPEAMAVNGLDRDRLIRTGDDPAEAMANATKWLEQRLHGGAPILVAYPLSFDWSFLYWYFMRFAGVSPFRHSRCFDIKTALSVKSRRPIAASGHDHVPDHLKAHSPHTHNALDDARAQAELFANLFEWQKK